MNNTTNKQLILGYEPISVTPQQITESLKKNGKFLVSCILQRADAPNQNNRIYPMSILQREAKNYQRLIKEKRAYGELDHPETSVVNLSNVSHVIREMHWKGNDLMGTVEVLNTPSGKILQELLKAGLQVGMSSRALGSVTEDDNGYNEVGEDLEIIAFDSVSNPSTFEAFMHPLRESVDKYGQTCINKYCRIQELVTEILIDCESNII